MVVMEKRLIFELREISAIRLKCGHCGAEFVQKLKDAEFPVNCPSPKCEERWAPRNSTASEEAGLLKSVRKVLGYSDAPVTIRFEIDGEEDKRG